MSLFSGWSQWLADRVNLVTKDELKMTTEAFDALNARVKELEAFATDTDASLDKAIVDIAALQKQIEDGNADKQAMLDLAASVTKTLEDAKSSVYVPPETPENGAVAGS